MTHPLQALTLQAAKLWRLNERIRHDYRRQQLRLRWEEELDRYLNGEIDEIRLERRGEGRFEDHLTTSRVVEYKPLNKVG